jgi:hypothetical protein
MSCVHCSTCSTSHHHHGMAHPAVHTCPCLYPPASTPLPLPPCLYPTASTPLPLPHCLYPTASTPRPIQAESMTRHYKTAILLIEFDADRAFALQSPSELGPDIDHRNVISRLALLLLHHPRLRLLWSRSLHATADMFLAFKANQDEPDAAAAALVGVPVGPDGQPVPVSVAGTSECTAPLLVTAACVLYKACMRCHQRGTVCSTVRACPTAAPPSLAPAAILPDQPTAYSLQPAAYACVSAARAVSCCAPTPSHEYLIPHHHHAGLRGHSQPGCSGLAAQAAGRHRGQLQGADGGGGQPGGAGGHACCCAGGGHGQRSRGQGP